nr:MAG TPA: hypothetical protein [Caudoviricetes sp.]
MFNVFYMFTILLFSISPSILLLQVLPHRVCMKGGNIYA